MSISTDVNVQYRHLTNLKRDGVLGNVPFYPAKCGQMKIIHNGRHDTYTDFMNLFPEMRSVSLPDS